MIKLIPVDPGNAELQLSRWRLAAKLSHPHLIRLFQMGPCQLGNTELLYAVMEYAEEDLSQILPHRPLTPGEAREMLESTLDALAHVHGNGFAHGHMKPANIMALDDRIKLSSDGLSVDGVALFETSTRSARLIVAHDSSNAGPRAMLSLPRD